MSAYHVKYRIILHVDDPDDMTNAARAARWMIDHPEQTTEAVIAYGDVAFLVRRNSTADSISVFAEVREKK